MPVVAAAAAVHRLGLEAGPVRVQQVQHPLAQCSSVFAQRARAARPRCRAATSARLPTGSSMVCSLKRSMRGNPVDGQEARRRCAGAYGRAGLAHLARSVYTPLRLLDQRRQQAHVLAAVKCAQQLRGDALGRSAPSPAAPSCTQCCRPSFTHSRRRKCHTSVVVADRALAAAARSAAARSPPWAECRTPRPPRAGRRAARCCARRR